MNTRTFLLAGLMGSLALTLPLAAQKPAPSEPENAETREQQAIQMIESFGWSREGVAKLGTRAQLTIPKGFRFTDGNGARKMMQVTGNLASDRELGLLTTEGFGPMIIFEFDESGYVKDDDKDQLDGNAMLKALKEGEENANEERRRMGMDELELVGWAVAPRYNDVTKNLEWATRIRSKNSSKESINYNTRLLGRSGVMEVTLVCSPSVMEALLPEYQKTIGSYSYLDGESYAEYRAGDKIAKYGVTALVAGGAAVAASKMGLFAKLGVVIAKLGKGIVVVVIAIGAALKGLFGKLFGSRTTPSA